VILAPDRVLIVAEVGNNHEGDLQVALELVDRAAEAGADAVKFQTYRTDLFVGRADAPRFERLKRFELAPADFARLADAAHAAGLLFFSTPLDLDSARMLERLVDAFKVASGDVTFVPLLQHIAQSGKPVILSSGASELEEIRSAVGIIRKGRPSSAASEAIAVLHCVSCYPVTDDQASLRAIPFLARALECPVGYSDHTLGIDAAVFAAVLGARIVEKHFTLDKQYSDFRDHQLSADPADLKELVARIRRFEVMAGREGKTLQPCEVAVQQSLRRSIVARTDLPTGHVVAQADLSWMRPASQLAPGQEQALIGRRVRSPLLAGDAIDVDDVER
jgi:N,N'-diacetyllegionaminate synthase